jgi:hypothetical protein
MGLQLGRLRHHPLPSTSSGGVLHVTTNASSISLGVVAARAASAHAHSLVNPSENPKEGGLAHPHLGPLADVCLHVAALEIPHTLESHEARKCIKAVEVSAPFFRRAAVV